MRIPTLPLTTNGTVSRGDKVYRWDTTGFTTAAAAINHSDFNNGVNGIAILRKRNLMQKGVIGYKKYTPTNYYAFSGRTLRVGGAKGVYRQSTNPLRFGVRYREIGFGYTGGSGTGVGEPWRAFLRSDTYNTPTAIANRAIIANTINRVNSEILVKARNNKMSLGESLVDVDRTVVMVATKGIQVYQAFRFLRSGQINKAFQALDLTSLTDKRGRNVQNASSVSARWLALQYGWLPLLSDIWDGVNFVNEKFKDPKSTFVVSRKAKQQLLNPGWVFNFNDEPWYNAKGTSDVLTSVSQKYVLKVKDQTMAYLASIGLDNPLYVAWQAIPYSFVLDWLLPVSDWLQALSTPLGLQLVSGYRSVRTEGFIRFEAVSFGVNPSDQNTVFIGEPTKSTFTFNELSRDKLTTFPIVQPYFRFPFSNPQRLTSAIALIQERRRG
ncbi:MAG: putative maturation protein [Yuhrihovirus faecenecus]|uniref:Maturation protein n=1 Tax=Leviviridae sp. TaxID=2027243 RepID=A0ABY3SSR9_9VIRU|nr:MAG: putative maturation protein [Leviviridae sp.]